MSCITCCNPHYCSLQERLSYLPKVTQPVDARAGKRTQLCLTPGPGLSALDSSASWWQILPPAASREDTPAWAQLCARPGINLTFSLTPGAVRTAATRKLSFIFPQIPALTPPISTAITVFSESSRVKGKSLFPWNNFSSCYFH